MIAKIRDRFWPPKMVLQKVWRRLRPMRGDYRSRFNMTLRDWMLYHQRHIHYVKCDWMGVKALKNPLDAWIYQEIIYKVKPDVIVEIGSYFGGSTLFFAHMLDLIGKGVVISIDINRENFKVSHERIVSITGNSSSSEVVRQVSNICHGKTVMVIQDGDHHKLQVLKDLRAYWSLVSLNSYLIVEDGIVDLFKPGDSIGSYIDGPLAAVEEFLKENSHFIVDSKCERFIITYNPKGYLKRVK